MADNDINVDIGKTIQLTFGDAFLWKPIVTGKAVFLVDTSGSTNEENNPAVPKGKNGTTLHVMDVLVHPDFVVPFPQGRMVFMVPITEINRNVMVLQTIIVFRSPVAKRSNIRSPVEFRPVTEITTLKNALNLFVLFIEKNIHRTPIAVNISYHHNSFHE